MTKTHEELLREAFEKWHGKPDYMAKDMDGVYLNAVVRSHYETWKAAIQTANAVPDDEVVKVIVPPIESEDYNGDDSAAGLARAAIQALKSAGYRIVRV